MNSTMANYTKELTEITQLQLAESYKTVVTICSASPKYVFCFFFLIPIPSVLIFGGEITDDILALHHLFFTSSKFLNYLVTCDSDLSWCSCWEKDHSKLEFGFTLHG